MDHTMSPENRDLIERMCEVDDPHMVSEFHITRGAMSDLLDAVRRETIERCAIAAEQQERIGYEWLRDTVWANILKRAGENVRALAKGVG